MGHFRVVPSLILDTKVFSILKNTKKTHETFCTYLDHQRGRFRNPATVICIITVRIILSFIAWFTLYYQEIKALTKYQETRAKRNKFDLPHVRYTEEVR